MSLRLAVLFGVLLCFWSPLAAAQQLGTHGKAYAPAGYVHRIQGSIWELFGNRRSGDDRPWSSVPREPEERKSNPQGSQRWQAPRWGTYRTVCVRLCDGYYWPISYATTRDRFSRDAKQCELGCPNRSRLFYHRSGTEVDALVDLNGGSYTDLKQAFLYRTKFVADCTCRGNPWDEQVIAQHRAYAEAAKTPKDKKVDAKAPPQASKSRWARAREGNP
jgi:Protein of unknown function (DUF2865)